MANSFLIGAGGMVAGALALAATSAFSGVAPSALIPGVPALAQKVVDTGVKLDGDCSAFKTEFNKFLEKAGVDARIETFHVSGTNAQPYGSCWVFASDDASDLDAKYSWQAKGKFVGAFDHRGYNNIHEAGDQFVWKSTFMENVLQAFKPDTLRKIAAAGSAPRPAQ